MRFVVHFSKCNLFADIPSCSHVDWAFCRFWTYLAGVPLPCPWLCISLPWNFSGPTPPCWWPHLWVTLFRHWAIHWRRGENRESQSASNHFLIWTFIDTPLSFRWSLEFWTLLSKLKIPTVLAFKVSQVHKCHHFYKPASKVQCLYFHAGVTLFWKSTAFIFFHLHLVLVWFIHEQSSIHMASAVHDSDWLKGAT